jgi:hypothetical protein
MAILLKAAALRRKIGTSLRHTGCVVNKENNPGHTRPPFFRFFWRKWTFCLTLAWHLVHDAGEVYSYGYRRFSGSVLF